MNMDNLIYSGMLGDRESYPMVDLDSDEEKVESSDDDLEVILHGTPEQKRKLRRQSLGQQSSSDDDFEKEMEAELNTTMKNIQKKHVSTNVAAGSAPGQSATSSQAPEFYDNSYFDSDSDEEGTKEEKTKKKRPVISNDDLLYDPNIDDDNQRWIDKQRRKYQANATGRNKKSQPTQPQTVSDGPKRLPHSDAILNCPACMTVLCLDCQRHDCYKNQYRAMFVMNCRIDNTEVLRFSEQGPKGRKNKHKHKKQRVRLSSDSAAQEDVDLNCDQSNMDTSEQGSHSADTGDMFNPVKCTICTTEVGVCDKDEVYHFFNVLASHG